jgi:hypothetical protein
MPSPRNVETLSDSQHGTASPCRVSAKTRQLRTETINCRRARGIRICSFDVTTGEDWLAVRRTVSTSAGAVVGFLRKRDNRARLGLRFNVSSFRGDGAWYGDLVACRRRPSGYRKRPRGSRQADQSPQRHARELRFSAPLVVRGPLQPATSPGPVSERWRRAAAWARTPSIRPHPPVTTARRTGS